MAHHRAGQLESAAAQYRAVLEVEPRCAVAWNMLGNVEYQRDNIDDALRLIGAAIELDPAAAAYRITMGHVYRRTGDLASASACYRTALEVAPDSVLAATSLADALFGLGVVASQQGDERSAVRCFEEAIVLKPEFAEALYNLGVVATGQHRLDVAEDWFRRALASRPDYVDAHVNLSAVLLKTGRADEARAHRELAYRRQCLFTRASGTAERAVLILFDAGRGNINLGHLFSPVRNDVIDWMIAFAAPGQADALPAFDLVFNAMGDPDMAGSVVALASSFIATCGKPVLNRPEAVAATARDKVGSLFAGVDGLFVPHAWRVASAGPLPSEMSDHLPLLLRPVDSHGGEGLQLVADEPSLTQAVRSSSLPLYATAFCDFRSADGWYRKYRVVFIDRQPYPYHLAISAHWLVHYATADMQAHAWKLEEERRFLEDPEAVLGAVGVAAITAIGARMDLDYAGVDFSVLRDGRILVFEANPVMFVHPEDAQGALAFKTPHVARILDAFEAMLARTAGRGRPA